MLIGWGLKENKMKKLFLISILVSLAWGQTCPYDGSGVRYRTGNFKTPNDGYISYEWLCEDNQHKNWSEEKIPNPVGADNDNNYKQQPQQAQQPQQQQVLPDYSPVIDAMKDKRTPEERKKQEEEYADGWEEGLAWNAMMKEKHPILLKVFQGVVLYGCYLLIQGEID